MAAGYSFLTPPLLSLHEHRVGRVLVGPGTKPFLHLPSGSGQAARFKTASLLFPLATCKRFPASEILPGLTRRVRHRTG